MQMSSDISFTIDSPFLLHSKCLMWRGMRLLATTRASDNKRFCFCFKPKWQGTCAHCYLLTFGMHSYITFPMESLIIKMMKRLNHAQHEKHIKTMMMIICQLIIIILKMLMHDNTLISRKNVYILMMKCKHFKDALEFFRYFNDTFLKFYGYIKLLFVNRNFS